jgi:hypothetical protein
VPAIHLYDSSLLGYLHGIVPSLNDGSFPSLSTTDPITDQYFQSVDFQEVSLLLLFQFKTHSTDKVLHRSTMNPPQEKSS